MKLLPARFHAVHFILVLNMFGMIPGFFTVTSHIVVTGALALIVFLTVIVYGFWRNGLRFFRCSCRAACRSTCCR